MKIVYVANTRIPTEMAHGLQIMKMCEAFASLRINTDTGQIYTDEKRISPDNPQESKNFLYEDITYKIRGCVFNVYNALGFGHKESVYQKALEKEFFNSGLKFDTQKYLDVYYNNEKVGLYKPDFIIEDKVVIEIKSLEFLSKKHQDQTLHYLKGTNYNLALLINFGAPKLHIKRLIFQHHPRESFNGLPQISGWISADKYPRKSTNNQCKSAKNQRESVQVELVVPWRFRISELGKKNPFEYYKVDRIFKIKKIFCFDLTPLNRFLGPISFLIQTLSFSFFTFIYLLFKFIRRGGGKTDIIYGRDRFGLFFISLFKKNVIFEVHKIHRFFFWPILKRVKKIVVITENLKEILIKSGIDGKKIFVAPDGVDLKDFDSVEADLRGFIADSRGLKEEEVSIEDIKKECRKKLDLPLNRKIVLYTGHLYKWKGVETLALASKFLRDDTIILIVGGILWYLTNFKKFVKKNNLKNILILGYQDYSKIPYFLKAADCLVLTGTKKSNVSQYQTSPMKMFEYMASGKPIIASDLPSFREVLYDNQRESENNQRKSASNAILVEPDNPQALAEGIKKVLNNPDLAKQIFEQAYKDVQKYTWDNRAKKILEFIWVD